MGVITMVPLEGTVILNHTSLDDVAVLPVMVYPPEAVPTVQEAGAGAKIVLVAVAPTVENVK